VGRRRFEQRREAVEQGPHLALVEHRGRDEQRRGADRDKRGIGFDPRFERGLRVVGGDVADIARRIVVRFARIARLGRRGRRLTRSLGIRSHGRPRYSPNNRFGACLEWTLP